MNDARSKPVQRYPYILISWGILPKRYLVQESGLQSAPECWVKSRRYNSLPAIKHFRSFAINTPESNRPAIPTSCVLPGNRCFLISRLPNQPPRPHHRFSNRYSQCVGIQTLKPNASLRFSSTRVLISLRPDHSFAPPHFQPQS